MTAPVGLRVGWEFLTPIAASALLFVDPCGLPLDRRRAFGASINNNNITTTSRLESLTRAPSFYITAMRPALQRRQDLVRGTTASEMLKTRTTSPLQVQHCCLISISPQASRSYLHYAQPPLSARRSQTTNNPQHSLLHSIKAVQRALSLILRFYATTTESTGQGDMLSALPSLGSSCRIYNDASHRHSWHPQ